MASRATGGGQIRVNSTDERFKEHGDITRLADGGWVVTWQSYDFHIQESQVYQQRYAATGAMVGDPVEVGAPAADYSYPSVEALADGGWLVIWSYDGLSSDDRTFWRRFDADGNAGAARSQNLPFDTVPEVTALSDGGWLLTWTLYEEQGGYNAYQQRFDSDGEVVGSPTRLHADLEGDEVVGPAAALADGGWVVTWSLSDETGEPRTLYQQRYAADGSAVGEAAQVNSDTSESIRDFAVTALSDGGWLVTWQWYDGPQTDVYQQRFDRDGNPQGPERLVNTTTNNYQFQSVAAGLADGGWVVAWTSVGQDGDGAGIYQQRYDANGNPVGGETQVNLVAANSQDTPAITALPGGGWVVSWRSWVSNNAVDGAHIHQRVFAADIEGTARADVLEGTAFDETIRGYGGNDTLDGKGGNDIMIGGFGDDTYIVDSAGDQVQEMAAQGTDTVRASISYTLGGSVENLVLTGSANLTGTGNSLANVITGNSGNNTLLGLAGNDRIDGGAGNDTLDGGTGNDTLIGGSGNDSLDGGTGADRMEGGTGNDTYYVDNSGDVVVEAADAGTDTVRSTISHTLAANVENLILTGSGNLNGNGNTLANVLTGNSGNNILKGLAGNDTLRGEGGNDQLTGGAGADKLYGGAGADRFIFTALSDSTVETSGRDMIYDFSRSQGDKIDLSAIDASTKSSGNQAFTFIGEKTAFTGKAGELRYVNSGGDTFIYGDVNGDKVSDFAIRVDADINFVKGDFIL